MEYYTYILLTSKNNYYYGHTDNLKERVVRHKKGEVRLTKRYLPVKLVYYELFETRGDAINREKYFKSLKNKNYVKELITVKKNNKKF
jgi:putative endonuclease